jgi:hypothetical protein
MNAYKLSQGSILNSQLLNSSIFIAIIMFLSFVIISWNNMPAWNVDNGYYIKVFEGQPVRRPFSVRILHPYLAKLIMTVSGTTIHNSFSIASSFALLLFLFLTVYLIKRITSYAFIAIPLLFNPFLLRSFQEAYMPDMLFLALVSLYIVLMYHSFLKSAFLVLLLLFITRDDALLLAVCTILVGIYLSQWKLVLSSALVMILGLAINSFTARFGLPSPANMNPLLFYLIRMPANLFYNSTGIPIWSNIYADLCHPIIKLDLPTWLPSGNLHAIGLCPFNITTPFRNIAFYLTTLGVLPSLLIYTLLKNRERILKSSPPYILIALFYGIISFVTAISLSMDIMRHVGEGWPAFWLALIFLLPLTYKIDKISMLKISIFNLVVSWIPWLLFLHKVKPTLHYQFSIESLPMLLVIIFGSILFHVYAIHLLQHQAEGSLGYN